MANSGDKILLEVQTRDETGKNACRRIRATGLIPGNVYGLDRTPFKVAVSPKRIDEVLRMGSGVNTVFTLTLSGESRHREAMIKELQRDPVTERPLHVDFVRVDPDHVVHVAVPIRLIGTPVGVRLEGGIVDFVQREVQVECLPASIPQHFDVDISELHVNQHVSIGDLTIDRNVKLLDEAEQIIAVIVAPKAEEAPAETAAAPEAAVTAEPAKKDDAAGA